MIQQFFNRKMELEFLEKKYSENSPQLIIIYGRRRVGKTELIKKFIQNKNSSYILCSRDNFQENIKEIKRKFSEITGKEYFLKLDANSLFDLFKYLIEEIKKEKIIIAIDEFSYLIELEKGMTSTFQKIWDELLKDTQVFLILCGSSMGMMESETLDYKSPLYGRRTGDWKIEAFKFNDLKNVFKKSSMEEIIKFSSVFGNTPFYLLKIDPNLSISENIKKKILTKGEILYNEPKILLREEFREPRTYMLILKYLSLGYNSQGELSSVTGIEKGNLSKYISVLEETQIIRYILPLGKRKRGIYVISEPFFNFWFRFVYPNLSDLEIGLINEVFERISPKLNTYFGLMFEELIIEILKLKEIKLPFDFNWVGRWWHKDKEIDVVALNEKTKDILFGECKWKENVNPEGVLKELKEKAQYVEWNNEKRKESYAIFAKSFSKKIKNGDVLLFDLNDMKKMLWKK